MSPPKDQNISVDEACFPDEDLDGPHMVARDIVVEVEDPEVPGGKVRQVGIPIRMSETSARFVTQVRSPGSTRLL